MAIALKRAYEPVEPADGERILVDRLWPRGISKDRLQVQDWLKDVAPSNDLRKTYHAGGMTWSAFRRAYLAELKPYRETLRPLARRAREHPVTLVYSASNPDRNNAVVLRQYLAMLGK
ncbi:DUF488 family protein [Marinobacter halodurans]|uniref:DUF488 family protein n=1 Tax=Marinobacter halodurans TaxID=2528979 RepID=A0ABY1ZID6_9GAMM|nr:DUF488 family protein [Marinobacter halodurans]TBW48126.1 DUF488 family protein [Marinobacter halodurans]